MPFEDIKITADDDGQRLDRLVKRWRPAWPFVLTQKLLRKGAVRVDGKRAAGDVRVVAGQTVRLPVMMDDVGGDVPSAKPPRIDLDILFEDEALLVINKPSGLAVQGGSGLKIHLEMLLEPYARHGVRPRLVHRLDRDTSGVLVLARTARAARRLGDAFATRQVEKVYDALVSPAPRQDAGTIEAALRKVEQGSVEKMIVDPAGDAAVTDYTVRARQGKVAWVEFRPLTGRTHQIRVHAAHIGVPLLGDAKYGGDWPAPDTMRIKTRVMLHARSIALDHPRSGERMVFTAPWPDDFVTVAKEWVGDISLEGFINAT